MSIYESIFCLVLGSMIIGSFFVGQLIGMNAAINNGVDCSKFQSSEFSTFNSAKTIIPHKKEEFIDFLVKERVEEELRKLEENKSNHLQEDTTKKEFKPSANLPIKKLAYVAKNDFIKKYDFGINETLVDKNAYTKDNQNVLMMYYKKDKSTTKLEMPTISSEKATEDCDIMLVVGNRAREDKHCLAYFNNYDSYHLQRFMRVGQSKMDSSQPLQHVGRGLNSNNLRDDFSSPEAMHIKHHWELLKEYLNSIDAILALLKPVVQRIAKDDTIVVMVCNEGQVELLVNFVCSSKAKGFDIGMLLVFATDRKTYETALGLGIEVFYDEVIFANVPASHSQRYGDRTFVRCMWAKIVCTHVVSMLNYNFLFQDVDITWYKHPLEFFKSDNSYLSNDDIFFQFDGNMQLRYIPYSANSGFYYVKSNDKTRYLFTSFIYAGDLLWTTHSHQQVLGQLLAEHTSVFNLRVKILPKRNFPGGDDFHSATSYMPDLILHKIQPWIFHMSWTLNKDNKLKFMKQMGMWYVKDTCEKSSRIKADTASTCCSATPLVSCYYRDKPSIVPCHDSPSLDKGQSSYWSSNPGLKNVS